MARVIQDQVSSFGQDLVPWADPYIVSLIDKLRRSGGRLLGDSANPRQRGPAKAPSRQNSKSPRNEATPPLDTEDPDAGSPYFGDDWSGRGVWRPE